VVLLEGDAKTAEALLDLPFDHIFFTGSTRIGRIVMSAAAKHLASVTLELGGKSPVVVAEDADLEKAAKRIVWGKFINAGQTCVAPDYVFAPEAKAPALVEAMKRAVSRYYGESEEDRHRSPDFCRLVDNHSFHRISRLIDDSVAAGAKVEVGGHHHEDDRYVAPTILTNVDTTSPAMKDEIFGPVLPILTYRSLDEVVKYIRRGGKPLAMYVFSNDTATIESLIADTSAGGTAINNVVVHLANPNLPFGGIGESGLGSYHGEYGFRAFSHERAVLEQGRLHTFEFFYPPYTPRIRKMVRKMTDWLH
jgi:aldehyde dehydrogenase (NAD+)